jgi:hypothetical protein
VPKGALQEPTPRPWQRESHTRGVPHVTPVAFCSIGMSNDAYGSWCQIRFHRCAKDEPRRSHRGFLLPVLGGLRHSGVSRTEAVRYWTASAALLMALAGCGLSNEDLAAYQKEIAYAEAKVKSAQKYTGSLLELNKQALANGYTGFSGIEESSKSMKTSMTFLSYQSCLDGYMRSKEKFVIAKTNCTLESGIKDK